MFTDEQLQLQSLIASGFVDSNNINGATFVANMNPADSETLSRVKTFLDELLAEPKIKYEFTNIFKRLNSSDNKVYSGVFQNYRFTMRVGLKLAKHPGAIYMISEKPNLGYIGYIDLDHSIIFAKGRGNIKEDLIKYLMDLNTHVLKYSTKPHDAFYGVKLIHEPHEETLSEQMARGPFDPARMQAILDGKINEP